MPAWLCILRLRSGTLYPGATTDVQRRFEEHVKGIACRTTNLDPAVSLAYSEEHPTFADARQREAQVKKWTLAKKEALVSGNTDRLKHLAKRQTR